MKKRLVLLAVATASAAVFAGPRGCPGPGGWGPCPRPCGPGWHHPPPPPHHWHGGWGPGGCNFWPGFVGGLVGGAVASSVVTPAPVVVAQPTVVTTPVVVQQPVVQQVVAQPVTQVQSVWVEGRYIDQVQANGTVVRVWSPGHYEQRTVVIQ